MQNIRKYMTDRFASALIEKFELYHARHMPNGDLLNTFITYLIDHRIIESTTVKRYTILEEYSNIINDSRHKTDAVITLSERFNISERSVWSIIKDHKGRFDSNN